MSVVVEKRGGNKGVGRGVEQAGEQCLAAYGSARSDGRWKAADHRRRGVGVASALSAIQRGPGVVMTAVSKTFLLRMPVQCCVKGVTFAIILIADCAHITWARGLNKSKIVTFYTHRHPAWKS